MAGATDEPRRSGRATKGQHTRDVDEAEPTEAPQVKTKAKAKGKKGKKAKTEEVQEEADEEPENIRCLCGEIEDDKSGAWVACDDKTGCGAWQHNQCMGVPKEYKQDDYFCEQCHPEGHPATVKALNAGELPADVAARNCKGLKKGIPLTKERKAKGSRLSPAAEPLPESDPQALEEDPSTLPTTVEHNKRKHDDEDNAPPPSKLRKGSSQAIGSSKSKANASAAPEADMNKLVDSIEELQGINRNRASVAVGLKTKLAGLIKETSSAKTFRIPDGDTADSLSERLAVLVEYSLFLNHCNSIADMQGAYRNQTQAIMANITKNMVLALEILSGNVNPDTLATMSASEMATDEQKARDAKMKEDNERQAILVQEEGTRIRRTHKGEELVGDSGDQFASESITSAAPPRRMLSHDEGEAATAGSDASAAGFGKGRPPPISTDGSAMSPSASQRSPPDARRSSSNFNIQNVWSSVHSPTGGQQRPMQQPPRRSSGPGVISPQAPDADIDRLLDNEDGDEAPYSPVETSSDPTLVWRGTVDMPIPSSRSIARFASRAYHVAGTDLGGREQCSVMFPHDVILAGRIAADSADEYLSSLSAARSTDVSVFELQPATSDPSERGEFNKLFDYLYSRGRYGVVSEKSHRPNVRDVYITPVDEGAGPMPQFLQRLDHNNIEMPRPRRMLFIVFVIRWKSPVPTPATPSTVPGNVMTPTAAGSNGPRPTSSSIGGPQAPPAMTPATPVEGGSHPHQLSMHQSQGSQAPMQQQYSSPFPSNPYGPPHPHSSLPQHTQPYQQTQSYPQHPQQQQQHAQRRELARNILGPYFNAPVAQQLLTQAEIPEQFLHKLKAIFEKEIETRTDFDAFNKELNRV